MKTKLIQIRIKESQLGKLNEIQAKLETLNTSETIRACINIAYEILFEKEKYLINFYDIKHSLLLKWLKDKGKC